MLFAAHSVPSFVVSVLFIVNDMEEKGKKKKLDFEQNDTSMVQESTF